MLNNAPPGESSASTTCTRSDAEAGNAEAQFGMGLLCSASATPDYAQALLWYQKAADQHHRLAQFNLGQMFSLGQGLPKDDSMALIWMQRAADGGDAGAQFHLGERHSQTNLESPEACNREARVESYKWFTLAAAQNYRDAMVRADSMTLRMTWEEVTEANGRINAFIGGTKTESASSGTGGALNGAKI